MDVVTYAMAKSYADKAIEGATIEANTPIDRGVYASKAALLAVPWQTTDKNAANYVKNLDIAVVQSDESHSGECWKYRYNYEDGGTLNGWTAYYRINESALVFDDIPTENSNNVVKSGGVYAALQDVDNSEEMTLAQYNALTEAQKMDGTVRYITDSSTLPIAENGGF